MNLEEREREIKEGAFILIDFIIHRRINQEDLVLYILIKLMMQKRLKRNAMVMKLMVKI
jgi:hypothetical protein